MPAPKLPTAAVPKKPKGLPPATRRTNGKVSGQVGIPLDPKDVIPFEDDVQFKDF